MAAGMLPRPLVMSTAWAKPVLHSINQARCRAWDLIHGVETCGDQPLANLDFISKNKTAGLEYQSHHPEIIRWGLEALPIDVKGYTFIDFGCGKGRVLLIASEYAFRKIIGVEFAPSLAEIARRNLKQHRFLRQRCSQIEVETVDATEYALAHEPQVLYFYSPFSKSVLDQILQNIEDSLRQSPRDLIVMFSGTLAMRDGTFGASTQYERLERGRYIDIYRHCPL